MQSAVPTTVEMSVYICLSVRHALALCQNDPSKDHEICTFKDSSTAGNKFIHKF